MKKIRHYTNIEQSTGVNDGHGLALTGGPKGFTQVRQFYIDTAIFVAELIRVATRAVTLLPV
ncbi:MAG: hypothetical protein U5L07_14270 [Desulfobacterales bacterium]|nr:hypothetical protein [Desulfobacterales bacterium]